MQFELPFKSLVAPSPQPGSEWLQVGSRHLRLWLVRHRRARRYVLRLRPDGSARVTIPRGGSAVEARRFAERNIPWLEAQLLKQALQPRQLQPWSLGTEILFRGTRVRLEQGADAAELRFGDQLMRPKNATDDLRPCIEAHLRELATRELAERTFELAALHQVPVKRVTVRSQRSRWGSCSRRGTVSLNWRLVQTPLFVRDYIILHELAHFKEMNHSRRFWREVERLCPDWKTAEHWLRQNSRLLRN